MIEILEAAGHVYLAAVVLYLLFLAYCTLRAMRDNKRFQAQPALVRAHGYLILGVALTVDVIFNAVVGTVVFLEIPEWSRLTFTARCKKWKIYDPVFNSGLVRWRSKAARWVCESWLNPAEPGHC